MRFRPFFFVMLLATTIVSSAALAQEAGRGQVLHETYCIMCHDARVYTRDDRLARDWREIRAQVTRWQGNASLKWSAEDIDRVAAYIATKYYGLNCPDEC